MKVDRRLRVWAHNALSGSCAMAQSFVERVLNSDSTTDEAKDIATQVRPYLDKLRGALKERKD